MGTGIKNQRHDDLLATPAGHFAFVPLSHAFPIPGGILRLHAIEICHSSLMGRIALIDDDESALELFRFVLEEGHRVITFSDAERFLYEVGPECFDLVVLDLMMPGIDGFEVFRQIQHRSPRLPVIAVTAKAVPADKEKALKAGFCDYFVKPIIEIDRFRETVFKHVGGCKNPPYKESVGDRA
jgi:CheY-like chemotaxis protein